MFSDAAAQFAARTAAHTPVASGRHRVRLAVGDAARAGRLSCSWSTRRRPHTLLCMPEVLVGGSGGDGRYSAVLGSGAFSRTTPPSTRSATRARSRSGCRRRRSAAARRCCCATRRAPPPAPARRPPRRPSGAVHGALDVLGRLGVRFWAPGVVAATAPPPRLPLPAPPLLFPWAMGAAHRTVPRFVPRALRGERDRHPAWAQAQHLHGGFDGGGGGGARIASPIRRAACTRRSRSRRRRSPPRTRRGSAGGSSAGSPTGARVPPQRARELVDDARKTAAAGTAAPTVVSVSQADNMSPCTSAPTAATDDEGSAMPPLLRTVNFVARGLAASHPGVSVDTLAYQHTQAALEDAPRAVIVRLSTIGADFSTPPPRAFRRRRLRRRPRGVGGGARSAGRPASGSRGTTASTLATGSRRGLTSMAPNLRLYADAGVDGVFIEGNYRAKGGELAPLNRTCTRSCCGSRTPTPPR